MVENEQGGNQENPEHKPGGESPVYSQQVHHDPIGARVPEHVGAGVFSTGTVVLNGPDEFVIDFLQGLARPPRIAARVIVNPRVMAQFVAALRENLQKYEAVFGRPRRCPARRSPIRSRASRTSTGT